jgi:2-methylisocitrate lyase-like PEP mutase family enzyme
MPSKDDATQAEKAERFRSLHRRAAAFVMPNPWDGGVARALAGLGFEALATSSGAAAGALGRRDGELTRDEALAHARAIVMATDLPVSGDMENGLYDIGHAADRIAAAAEAARALPFAFTLTARAENFFRGNPDLDDTIKRLQAYEKAGADVLFAPALPDLEAVRTVCAALNKPFSFMAGIKGKSFTVAELQAAGVKRISVATSLYRAAMAGMLQAAQEVRQQGSFGYLDRL